MNDHIIDTPRLQLIPLRSTAELHALWTQTEIRRHLWDDEIIPETKTAGILQQNEQLFAERRFGLWAVREKSKTDLAGFCGLWYFRDPPELELIVGLHGDRWHHGFGSEAARAIIDYAFHRLGFPQVRASADAANIRSHRMLERAGMRFEKRAVVAGIDTMFFRCDRGRRESDHRTAGSR